jgi:hypothetical protein
MAPKAKLAADVLSDEQRETIARAASYVGSPFHKDTPSFVGAPSPRMGAVTIQRALERDIVNPDCTLCPRRWARRRDAATDLLRDAIRKGLFEACSSDPKRLPKHVWARDPENSSMVYEARRLTHPANGYKGYPLTPTQAKRCPLRLT